MSQPNWASLIPELREWNNGQGIEPRAWVSCVGNFQLAAGYTTIFWPEFVEYDDMVLHDGFDREALAGFMHQCRGDKSGVEAVMNHLHLEDLHHFGCPAASHERLVFLGRTLKEIYECKLRAQFPQRNIVVDFDEGAADDLHSCQLTFFQRRG